ncbi:MULTISPECIES: hypothetical protein [unclassified Arenibacter]|uniref:hypothetical protein n=1 Tax=unclassified Arenibacter TaxID=2615047 RepID=UPI000E347DC9|nr:MULTISPECIES: hypothetical protein [unclassified Arenibacter]MCM4164030.1 hypothetical protein [Arenibacter sp. A80]RFT56727.1 hypothetical protein D0S24_10505 [Arenibacter sp. P308M17]
MFQFKYNLNDIHLYEWGDLWWFEYEVQVGLWALQDLIKYQEEIYHLRKDEFIKSKEKRLAQIPVEYKDSYEQHSFEDGDRTFTELIKIQRNSVCLSIFSYLEGQLIKLLRMMAKVFKIDIEPPTTGILSSIKGTMENTFEVNNESYQRYFGNIINQLGTRNAIAHENSHITDKKKFRKTEGLELRGLEIIISDIKYLEFLINQAEKLFENLLVAIDKRLSICT